MIKWTNLAPWQFEFPFPSSLTSTFLPQTETDFYQYQHGRHVCSTPTKSNLEQNPQERSCGEALPRKRVGFTRFLRREISTKEDRGGNIPSKKGNASESPNKWARIAFKSFWALGLLSLSVHQNLEYHERFDLIREDFILLAHYEGRSRNFS
jgi:hypothetical protein